ncbi:hypothetical protein AVEN_247810-1 [Araneus ventricosus]|uniref:MBD domain-containing protein n=1 Tax=Araneus ventricosus TaxID=182803 RepID=A0A4Y2SXT1_ARAVE|nr:hypothetical protein AVEN_247810-1 [Araneus ventricosus]
MESALDPDYTTNRTFLGTGSYIDDDEITPAESCHEPKSSGEKVATWIRKAVPRPHWKRTDIYYYEEGKTELLRPLNEVRDYCFKNKLKFQSDLFDFKGTDTYSGVVSKNHESSSSMSSE